ncbi:CUB and sushi domain-containing protein 1 [Patella vulgata]|uniref:CUB and sushi domain-containing protein 1 n=1 Tax=Patella vulgata TaxID=6465 RepID=UPI0024A8F840|nr:CUB and sushi domain-containing protein 1 [Patella vulgata]
MQTRGYDTGKGFMLKYKQGCSIEFVASQGEISTPGFINSKYPNNVKCDYIIKETNGQPMTLSFDEFTTKAEDTLKVYRGMNESGILVDTFKGDVVPSNILAANGMLFLKFEADGTGTEKGFRATFSVDCPAPDFNENTITDPINPSNSPDSRIMVSCKTGYHFAAEEFRDTAVTDRFVSKTSVTMVCSKGGKWSTLRIPMCEPLYCGQAPSISSGYISSATGATVGHNVTYACYNGYNFANPNTATISCKVDGTWESAPICQGATCPSLPSTSNFVQRSQTGTNSNNFGAIYTYGCLDGYDLIGSPIIFCQSNGTWTHGQPTCRCKF